ncbi:MAG: HAD family phosphatase [Caldilineaceae bacterium]|nr:HAD family phosphatase [Caldilineaceae bacterium]
MKVIIFDLGRVLVDYDHAQTLAGMAAISQVASDEIRSLTAGDIGHKFGVGEMSAREFHAYLVAQAGMDASFEAFIDAYAAGLARNEIALLYGRLLRLRPHHKIGILSNTNEAHVLWLRQHLPELQEFDSVIMSNEVGLAKPDAAIYELALAQLGAKAKQAIFVDDLSENVRAAQALGLAGIVHENWRKTTSQLEKWLMSAA